MKAGDVVQHRFERLRMVIVELWDSGDVVVCQRWADDVGAFVTKAYPVRDIEMLERAN